MAENEKLTIDELSEKTAKKAKISKELSEDFIKEFFGLIGKSLEKEDQVPVYQFGIFKKKYQKEKAGINPQTKEKIKIPAHYRVSFKASSQLSNRVNEKYRHLRPNVLDQLLTLTGIRKLDPDLKKELEKNKDLQKDYSVAKKRALAVFLISAFLLLVLLAAIVLIPVYFVNENNKVVGFVKRVNQMLGLNEISDRLINQQSEIVDREKMREYLLESKNKLKFNRKEIAQHQVKSGESIFSIAANYWENEYLWPDLYYMNRDEFVDPDLIHPGDILKIYEKLGDPDQFNQAQRDQIVQAYIVIYRIYRHLGEKDLETGKKNKNVYLIRYGNKRLDDCRWTLYTAVRYDHGLLNKYKEAIYPEDLEIVTEYVKRFGPDGKNSKK